MVKTDVLKEKWEITALQLKCWELRQKGLTNSQIRDLTGVDARNVPGHINRFQSNYVKIRQIVERLGDRPILKIESYRFKTEESKDGKVKKGYFVASKSPYGYRKVRGELVEVPEELEKVVQVFNSLDQGKSLLQTAKVTGLSTMKVNSISRNPIYKGFIRWKGQEFLSRTRAVVSPEVWSRVQNRERNRPWGAREVPVGYKYEAERVVIDPEKVDAVRRMFRLRSEGKTFAELDRQLGLGSTSKVAVRNPFYAAKKRENGKWVNLNHEPIVDFALWSKANSVIVEWYQNRGEKARQTGKMNRNKILTQLFSGHKTASQLAKITGLSLSGVKRHLETLKKDGFVEQTPVERKRAHRWRFKGTPQQELSSREIIEELSSRGKTEIMKRILQTLLHHPATASELRERTNLWSPTVVRCLRRLKERGIVAEQISDSHTIWAVTSEWIHPVQEFLARKE